MAISVRYVTREASTNLWRNRLMTIAGVLTVAVSLALVGSVLLLKQGAAHATEKWQGGVNVIAWIEPDASPSQVQSIHQQLVAVPYVKTCTYYSQAYDYAEAKRDLSPDLVDALSAGQVPSSYRCVLSNPSEAPALAQQFDSVPGMFQANGPGSAVTYPGQQIKTMQSVIHILQWVFLVVAVVLLLSAAVLILNTIRMAIFARRREVSVMKLVGATNWFIRLPFMAEGFAQGLAGAAVAVLAVFGIYYGLGLDGSTSATSIFAQMSMGVGQVVMTSVVVVLAGVVVGMAGSALAVRRFLDV